MARDKATSVDLQTTTLANLADLFSARIADALRDLVRKIVREELEQVREVGDS